MHKFPTHRHSHKRNFVTKKVLFLLICLHLHIIDHIRKHTFEGKKFFHSFIHFTHFKHVLKEVDRKVVTEPVFISDRGFTIQLCLWAPPLPHNLTQTWCKNSGMAWTLINSSITGNVLSTITPLKWLFAMYIIFYRNTGRKTSKTRPFESNLRYPSCFKSFTDPGF